VVESSWRSRQLIPLNLSNEQVELRDRLADCNSSESRAKQALHAIVQMTQTAGGYLFRCAPSGELTLLAQDRSAPVAAAVLAATAEYLGELLQKYERTQTVSDATMTESDATASLTGAKSQPWQHESCAGFIPQLLTRSDDAAPLGVALLEPGAGPARAADRGLMDVLLDALIAGGELTAPARAPSVPALEAG
jgi:hypothetical protein